jgi:hypothetical protein
MEFLPAVFLDIAANESGRLPIPDSIFEEILALLASEQFQWNYSAMTATVAAICERTGFLYEFQLSAATMFAHFLTKSDCELRERGFESETLATLKRALNLCADAVPDVVRHLQLRYRGDVARMNRLAAVLGLE